MSIVAVLLAAGTLLALFPPPARLSPRNFPAPSRSVRVARWAIPASAVLAGTLVWLRGSHLVLALIGLGVVGELVLRAGRRRAAAAAQARTAAVLSACDVIASDLAAGRTPRQALWEAAREWPELAGVARAADLDADVPTAFRVVAQRPGADQCRLLASAWQVAGRTGAGLRTAMEMSASVLRREHEVERVTAGELASARATAHLLTLLPVGVLAVGSGLQADPVHFLSATPVGLGCLAAGLGLIAIGERWLERIGAGR